MGQHLDLGPTGLSWALYGSITTLAGVHPAWDAARSFLEISMSISNYHLPADPYADWKGSEAPGYVPTARQQPLLDAFAAARASGLRYTADIAQFVSKQLCLTAEVLGVLSRNRRKFRQPINVACPAPGRWGRPNSRVTSRHFDHGNASRTSRPDCSGLDEAD